MVSLVDVLRQIYSPQCFAHVQKILCQITVSKLDKEIILLLRNIVRINNKDIQQFDGLVLVINIIKKCLKYEYTSKDWLAFGENFSCLIISIIDSFFLYQNTSYMNNNDFLNLILGAGKTLLPVVDEVECLRRSVNNNGFSSMFQLICLDKLDFLVRKEIFLLYKCIIVKSDTRQKKTIMNSNELFLSKLAAFIIKYGDFETQEAVVEVLMRFSFTSKQKLNKLLFWFRNYPSVLTATRLLDYKNFDISCRKFLNAVNGTIHSEDKVLTLPCFEAYANDIKLQKPRSEEYEELWVDFSLRTGIIHIVCDSGANAWLRLFIDSKNVKKSLISSRIIQRNDTEIKGKQILLELISPLEIELYLKENLVVTVTLIFVESPKLSYLQTQFFDKWHQHLNREKANHFEVVSKAFRESFNQRRKHQEKFFSGTSVSSLSTIWSCSTCSNRTGCRHRKGLVNFPCPKSNKFPFSTSTPKEINKCFQHPSPLNNNLWKTCFGTTQHRSSPNKLSDLLSSGTALSGGIFNPSTHNSQKIEKKSSIVKGISISDEKEEDGLFKRMIEETFKKDKNKPPNSSFVQVYDTNKPGPSNSDQGQNALTSSFDCSNSSRRLKLNLSKQEMTNNLVQTDLKKQNLEKDGSKEYNQIWRKDSSEESPFIMTYKKPCVPTDGNKECSEIQTSSSSQVGTSDEALSKSGHKPLNLLNPENKQVISMKQIQQPQISDQLENSDLNKNLDAGTGEASTREKCSLPSCKKPIFSPYLKLFNMNNSFSSVHSDRLRSEEMVENTSEDALSKKSLQSSTHAFRLKPSTLKINNDVNIDLHNSFTFYTPQTGNSMNNKEQGNLEFNDTQKNTPFGESNFESEGKKIKNKGKCDLEGAPDKNLTNEATKQIIDKTLKEISLPHSISNNISSTENNKRKDYSGLLFSDFLQKEGSLSSNDSITYSKYNIPSQEKHDKDVKNILRGNSSYDVSNIQGTSMPSTSFDAKVNSNHTFKKETSNKKRKLSKEKPTECSVILSSGPNTTVSSPQSYHCIAVPEKTYSTRPVTVRKPTTPDKIFDSLKPPKVNNNRKNKKQESKTRIVNRKRKLFTPNSSLEEMSPNKTGEDSVTLILKNSSQISANMRKSSNILNHAAKSETKKEKSFESSKRLTDVYKFSEGNSVKESKEEDKVVTRRRKSLRAQPVKRYKELSSNESDMEEKENVPLKRSNISKQKKKNSPKILALPSEKLSVSEKVSKFVESITNSREEGDIIRDNDLESEMKLDEAPVEENKSDISQLEAVEPPVWLPAGGIDVPSPQRSEGSYSDISLTSPTVLQTRVDNSVAVHEEMDFLQSLIKNIECLSLSVKRKPAQINCQDKLVKTVESFSKSSIEEMNKKWDEAQKHLRLMLSNMENLSDSCKTFILSFEKRLKDMIESSIKEFNMDRGNSNKRSENLCKELKKMCNERHKLLQKK